MIIDEWQAKYPRRGRSKRPAPTANAQPARGEPFELAKERRPAGAPASRGRYRSPAAKIETSTRPAPCHPVVGPPGRVDAVVVEDRAVDQQRLGPGLFSASCCSFSSCAEAPVGAKSLGCEAPRYGVGAGDESGRHDDLHVRDGHAEPCSRRHGRPCGGAIGRAVRRGQIGRRASSRRARRPRRRARASARSTPAASAEQAGTVRPGVGPAGQLEEVQEVDAGEPAFVRPACTCSVVAVAPGECNPLPALAGCPLRSARRESTVRRAASPSLISARSRPRSSCHMQSDEEDGAGDGDQEREETLQEGRSCNASLTARCTS